MVVSFIGGENRGTRRKPTTWRKLLKSFTKNLLVSRYVDIFMK
jgi:hypothetical protein